MAETRQQMQRHPERYGGGSSSEGTQALTSLMERIERLEHERRRLSGLVSQTRDTLSHVSTEMQRTRSEYSSTDSSLMEVQRGLDETTSSEGSAE